MADQFMMCARDVRNGAFIAEPGISRHLVVPEDELPSPKHEIDANLWFRKVRKAATWGKDERDPRLDRGDLLVFVHGYDNTQQVVMQRHAWLKYSLAQAGFKGEVMSFDWPSDDKAVNYLEDRHDAKTTAMQMVNDCIYALSERQAPDCTINIHVLAHSTGALVVREAFDDADDSRLPNNAWNVSQVVFIGGDISRDCMSDANPKTQSLFRHCIRLTNYSNLYDSVLKLSNAKRMGMAPRVGRNGLPLDAPTKAINIDCSDYYSHLSTDALAMQHDQLASIGTFDHSWHIGNRLFAQDLFETLRGDLDRKVMPTRTLADGCVKLRWSA